MFMEIWHSDPLRHDSWNLGGSGPLVSTRFRGEVEQHPQGERERGITSWVEQGSGATSPTEHRSTVISSAEKASEATSLVEQGDESEIPHGAAMLSVIPRRAERRTQDKWAEFSWQSNNNALIGFSSQISNDTRKIVRRWREDDVNEVKRWCDSIFRKVRMRSDDVNPKVKRQSHDVTPKVRRRRENVMSQLRSRNVGVIGFKDSLLSVSLYIQDI